MLYVSLRQITPDCSRLRQHTNRLRAEVCCQDPLDALAASRAGRTLSLRLKQLARAIQTQIPAQPNTLAKRQSVFIYLFRIDLRWKKKVKRKMRIVNETRS
jgi:hypothetical protein